MKFSKIRIGMFCALMLLGLCGCDELSEDVQGANKLEPINEQDYGDSSNAENLIDSATMIGSVTSFYSDGCSMNQTISEDGGQTAKIAAEGNDSSDTNVNIVYSENCIFQIARIDIATGNMVLSDASISDVKKSTSIAVFGEIQDTHNLIANKIVITKYE